MAFSSGIVNNSTWLIVLANKRIVFLDKGMFFGLKQISIPLKKINSISSSTGIMFGKIGITHGSETMTIGNVWKKTVKPFTNMIQEQLELLDMTK